MEEEFPEFGARLKKLTPRERETLGWLCAGLTIAEISTRMICSKSNVLFHLSHVYEKLGVGGMSPAVRQREMGKVCLAFQKLSNGDQPATSPHESASEPEAEPDLTEAPQRALVAVLRDDDARDGANVQPPLVEPVEPPAVPRHPRSWLRSLLILFGTAVVGGVVGAVITAVVLSPGRPALVREVVVTATPNLAVAAAPPTPILTGTTAASVTPLPSASPTARPSPSPTTPPTATALTGNRNLPGKVPSDIPGVLVAPGVTISSVIDQHTKPRDVYAVRLAAGQTLQLQMTVNTGMFSYSIEIANPDAASFTPGAWHGETLCNYYNSPCTESFTAAVAGTYYVAVVANGATVPYTLRLTVR